MEMGEVLAGRVNYIGGSGGMESELYWSVTSVDVMS